MFPFTLSYAFSEWYSHLKQKHSSSLHRGHNSSVKGFFMEPSTSTDAIQKQQPAVALLCRGAFDPPTYAHFRMFERARDFIERTLNWRVVEGIMSPCNDLELATTFRTPAKHRLKMLDIAAKRSYWIRSGSWECYQQSVMRASEVWKNYQRELSAKHGCHVKVLLLCGSNVIEKLSKSDGNKAGQWNLEELEELLKAGGLIALRRPKCRAARTIYSIDVLRKNQKNIFLIEDETFPNDICSLRIRTAIRRGESVKYCLDDDVINYISEHDLYQNTRRLNVPRDICRTSFCSSTTSSTPTSSSVKVEFPLPKSERSPSSSTKPTKYEYRTTDLSPNQLLPTKISVSASVPAPPPAPPPRGSSEGRSDRYKENLYQQLEEQQRHLLKQIRIDEPVTLPNVSPSLLIDEPKKERSSSRESSSEGISKKLDDAKEVSIERDAPPEYAVIRKSGRINKPPGPAALREEMSMLEPIRKTPKHLPNLSNSSREPLRPVSQSTEIIERRREIIKPLESPSYDNVTSLDELLLASTSWAEYMNRCNAQNLQKYQEYKIDEHYAKDSYAGQVIESEKVVSPRKEKKRSWFFMRSKSLKEPSSKASTPSEDESLIRICGADRRQQSQTSPEILWRKISRSIQRDRDKDKVTKESPKKSREEKQQSYQPPLSILQHKESTGKGIRFLHNNTTKSADNIHRLTTPVVPQYEPMSVSCYDDSSGGGVTLRYRRYRLSATPETTV